MKHTLEIKDTASFESKSVLASSTTNKWKRLYLITLITNGVPDSFFKVLSPSVDFKTQFLEEAIKCYNTI
jgi:hypothetical protein